MALLAFCVVVCGCVPEKRVGRKCELASSAVRAEFILKCAEAANPKSDEEGEDLVSQCEQTSERLYCENVVWTFNSDGYWEVK